MKISKQYLDFTISIAKEAGKIMKDNFKIGMTKKIKADNTFVTETDLAINTLLIKKVKKEFPEHDILAEEESDMSRKSDYVWVCDPVDGTLPFSHGIPTCVFSLALVYKGQPIVAVVYDPFLDRMFYAEKGKGAFLNNERTFVSKEKDLKKSLIGYAIWKNAKFDIRKTIDRISQEFDRDALRLGSITYVDALVAAGELEAAIFPGISAHDSAAIKLIVEEAGGKVTDLFGNEQRYDRELKGCLASNGLVHKEILSLLKNNSNLSSEAL